MDRDFQSIYKDWANIGQAHIFHYWNLLDYAKQQLFLKSLEQFNPQDIYTLSSITQTKPKLVDTQKITPPPVLDLANIDGQELEKVQKIGENLITQEQVAILTVAGGQGTRLNHSGPKGTFPITPILGNTLFQIFAEKLLANYRIYKIKIHWFIMTSPINHDETITFFKKNNFFGLPSDYIHFFSQDLLPSFDFNGKLLLDSPHSLSLSPNGHGGIFKSFMKSGSLNRIKSLNIPFISYFQIDNPLAQPLDPLFLGYHYLKQSEFSSKCILKQKPEEKVGLFIQKDKHVSILEYSDAPASLLNQYNQQNELLFNAANIAIHLLNTDFIEKIAHCHLPYHCSQKKIPHINLQNTFIQPQEPNGLKCEQFIFDALIFAKNPLILKVKREETFSPLKNETGVDSIQTCKENQIALWKSWFAKKNIHFPESYKIEISPLWAHDFSSFEKKYHQEQPMTIPETHWLLTDRNL